VDDQKARQIVMSVTQHCYYNSDNPSRVFFNLEDDEDKLFGECGFQKQSVSLAATCSVSNWDTCQVHENPCGNYIDFDSTVSEQIAKMKSNDHSDARINAQTPIFSSEGHALCGCAAGVVDVCRCLFELTSTQKSAFCVGSRAPQTFSAKGALE